MHYDQIAAGRVIRKLRNQKHMTQSCSAVLQVSHGVTCL